MMQRMFNKEAVVGSDELYSKEYRTIQNLNATLKMEQVKDTRYP